MFYTQSMQITAALVVLLLLVMTGSSVLKQQSKPTRKLTAAESHNLEKLVESGKEIEAIRDYRKLTGAPLGFAVTQVRNLKKA